MIGTHDRAVMAAEREVEREAIQSAASAELEARGGSDGQSRPSVGDATSMSAEGKPSTPELAFHGCDAATVAPMGASAGPADIQCENSAVENTNSREHSAVETSASVTSDTWPPRWMMLLGGVI